MKTNFKSMMVIGMMILGTATTFAATDKMNHASPSISVEYHTKKECNLRHIHDSRCGGGPRVDIHNRKMLPGMSKELRKHILKGNHKFNRHGVCRKCDLTRSEIRHIEREMEHSHPTPPPPHRR